MEKQSRRDLFKKAGVVAVSGAATLALAGCEPPEPVKKAIHHPPAPPAASPCRAEDSSVWPVPPPPPPPPPAPAAPVHPGLFNSIVTFGNLVFIAGIGAHFVGTIEEHTKHVLDEMEQNLILAGTSMDKVLKVNVYLSDLDNYAGMNSMYLGRFGDVPPVRTTVAVSGLPGNSLVEIDCIASL